jgi:hypothetical protein
MPTLGWILESDEDRFFESIEDAYLRFIPTQYICPFCTESLLSRQALRDHVIGAHPVERPSLLVKGMPAPATITLRAHPREDEIETTNCSRILVTKNGRSPMTVAPDDLSAALAHENSSHYEITLENVRAIDGVVTAANYTIRIRVADPHILKAIDRTFVELLAVPDFTVETIALFAKKCTCLTDDLDYPGALGDYAYGILAKEGSGGTSLRFEAFKDKFEAAYAVLRDYPRFLARAILSSIRLNFNNFSSFCEPSSLPLLDRGMIFFGNLAAGRPFEATTKVCDDGGHRHVCPIDMVSQEILRYAGRLAQGDALWGGEITRCMERAGHGTITPQDQSKLLVVCAVALRHSGQGEKAIPILRNLVNDEAFGRWANAQLNEAGGT